MRISDWSSDVCSSDLKSRRFARSTIVRSAKAVAVRSPKSCRQRTSRWCRARATLIPNGSRIFEPMSAELPDFTQARVLVVGDLMRSEEHTSELQSLMRISYAVFCLNKKKQE